jgi:hypothetical protein
MERTVDFALRIANQRAINRSNQGVNRGKQEANLCVVHARVAVCETPPAMAYTLKRLFIRGESHDKDFLEAQRNYDDAKVKACFRLFCFNA